jgi:hypothetical protein
MSPQPPHQQREGDFQTQHDYNSRESQTADYGRPAQEKGYAQGYNLPQEGTHAYAPEHGQISILDKASRMAKEFIDKKN